MGKQVDDFIKAFKESVAQAYTEDAAGKLKGAYQLFFEIDSEKRNRIADALDVLSGKIKVKR